jgi:hypothetical protein
MSKSQVNEILLQVVHSIELIEEKLIDVLVLIKEKDKDDLDRFKKYGECISERISELDMIGIKLISIE